MSRFRIVQRWLSACIMVVFICTPFSGCSKSSGPAPSTGKNEVNAQTTLLATIAENELPHIPQTGTGYAQSLTADQKKDLYYIDFNQYGTGVAYIANVGDQVHVVLNGKPLKMHTGADIAALKVSPDGKRVAYGTVQDKKWFVVLDGIESGPYDEIGPPVFSPNSKHVAFEARKGDNWNIVVDNTISTSAPSYFDKPLFSADSSKLMIIENTAEDQRKRYVVSSLKLDSLTDLSANAQPCVVCENKRRIAVVGEEQGKNFVTEFSLEAPAERTKGPLYDSIRHLSLSADGSAVAYIAKRGNESFIVLNDKEERLPDGEIPWPPVIRPGNKGVGVIIAGKEGAYLHQAFSTDKIKHKRYKECADLVYSNDGLQEAHGAIKDEKFMAVVNGVEGPLFDRVISPKFSPDGKYLVYRARKGDERFIVVTDSKGVVQRQHPSYERVFEPVFTADGKSVAYGVKDGKKLVWKVEKL